MARVSRATKRKPTDLRGEVAAAAAENPLAAPANAVAPDALGQAAAAAAATGAPQPDPQPTHRLRGSIDEASPYRITGWVWDPQQPGYRITLDLLEGDLRLARVLADGYRADLAQAGIDDGWHGFVIPLGPELLPEAQTVLHLRCAETGAEIPGSPITITRSDPRAAGEPQSLYEPAVAYVAGPAAANPASAEETLPQATDRETASAAVPAEPAMPPFSRAGSAEQVFPRLVGAAPEHDDPAAAGLQSHVDVADWTGISGWIWAPDDTDRRIALELLDGDDLLTTVLANQYRKDLQQAGIGDGRYGFSITFNETLLPNARHVLHLRPRGAKLELPSFPLELTRDEAGVDDTVRFVLNNIVADSGRAQSPEALAPLIGMLVESLDAALSRYFDLADETTARAAELLSPADFPTQFKSLVDSLQWHYPPLVLDTQWEPLLSIVIPVFNKFDLTYNCIKSIVDQGAEIPFEIIIVDDCSRDETMLAGFAFGPGIRLIRNTSNAGFIRSCNRGFDAARGEYVVFLNNDTEVKARWLDELYETFQRDGKVGVAGSKLLFPDGSLQECGGIVWRLGDGWNWGRGQAADDPRYCFMRDADYVSGAALMIRSNLFAELGKFDEHYAPAYYEDTDLCFRVRQAGYRVVVQPASEVVHFEGQSAGTSTTGTGMKRFQPINHRKFFERWKDALATHRFNGELPELEVERDVRQRAIFIDDSVPEPDKDAGSNAAFQHMLSLQRLGYKVTFIPGDNMARIEPYTTDLQRRGIECLYHPFYFSVEDVFRKQEVPVDLVYLHRYSNASKYAGMVRQHFPKARIVYNVADLHFLRLQREAELLNDVALRDKAEQMRRLELGAMSFVDCVIVHSSVEADLLRQVAPQIEVQVIPWTVTPRDIDRKSGAAKPGIAFVGGYRHPPNVDAAKWATQELMPLLRERVPGIELLLVGSNMPAEVTGLTAKDVVPLGYVPSLDSVFQRVRLTIAPLRYGAGLKGKVLESMAAGIPCVMTTVAAEGIDLPDELAWLVADEPDALAERVATLCRDDARYQRIVHACKAHVAANYSPARIDGLIREACGRE